MARALRLLIVCSLEVGWPVIGCGNMFLLLCSLLSRYIESHSNKRYVATTVVSAILRFRTNSAYAVVPAWLWLWMVFDGLWLCSCLWLFVGGCGCLWLCVYTWVLVWLVAGCSMIVGGRRLLVAGVPVVTDGWRQAAVFKCSLRQARPPWRPEMRLYESNVRVCACAHVVVCALFVVVRVVVRTV